MRIALLDPIDWDYHVDTPYERPLGGSQSAACYLAAALAQRGHQIFFVTNTTQPGLRRGVSCLALPTFTERVVRSLGLDVCVLINMPSFATRIRPWLDNVPLLLWTQHDIDQSAVSLLREPSVRQAFDGFAFVSDWQCERYWQQFQVPRERSAVLGNAVSPAFEGLFPDGESIVAAKTLPPVLVYTSTPFRGLDLLLELFPRIRAAIPNATLKVFSSLKVYNADPAQEAELFGALYNACRQTEGVEYIGSVPQPELAAQLRSAALLAYPNTYPETSCISVMEALAAGCYVVTSRLGALPETLGDFGTTVSLDDGPEKYGDDFVAACVAHLRRFTGEGTAPAVPVAEHEHATRQCRPCADTTLNAELRCQVNALRMTHTWEARALEWGQVCEQLQQLQSEAAVQQVLKTAIAHHQAGRIADAAVGYRDVLSANPRQPDALHLLGLIAFQNGRQDEALDFLQDAIAVAPGVAEYHANLALMWQQLNVSDNAIASARRALTIAPQHIEALHTLGTSLTGCELWAEAAGCFEQLVSLVPSEPEFLRQLGMLLFRQNRLADSAVRFEQLVRLAPLDVDALRNLTEVYRRLRRLPEALEAGRQAVRLHPNDVAARNNLTAALLAAQRPAEAAEQARAVLAKQPHDLAARMNLGAAQHAQGQLEEAERTLSDALLDAPSDADLLTNLGAVLNSLGRLDDSERRLRQALAFRPQHAGAHGNLGRTQLARGQVGAALESLRRAVELDPDDPLLHNGLAAALKDAAALDEAVAECRKALALDPQCLAAHSDFVYLEQFRPNVTPARLLAEYERWDRQHAEPLRRTWRPHANGRDPERRLRIGLISPNLGLHPCGFFLIRGLESLDRERAEIVCYSDRRRKDEMTARIAAASETWRDIAGQPDETVADQIRADRIDVLVALASHSAEHRLLVFARRPAPVQVMWTGGGPSGLSAIDALLADRFLVPEGAERFYRERQVVRLPDDYVCWDPPPYAPPVGPLPALAAGHVTFGCFNQPSKFNGPLLALWADVLRRVPDSRLLLKSNGVDDVAVRDRIAGQFAAEGVAPERLECSGRAPHGPLLDAYNRVDIVLDPLPFSGGVTTIEALWMGVPVVTWPGETYASRTSLSHLSNAGLTETIAADRAGYVECAVRLAEDRAGLAELRRTLRDRVAESPLCDGPRFARHWEAALRELWRAQLQKPAPSAGR